MSKIESLEEQVHGRQRDMEDDDELHFGVLKKMLYARNTPPVEGAQWTGIVTQASMLGPLCERSRVTCWPCVSGWWGGSLSLLSGRCTF